MEEKELLIQSFIKTTGKTEEEAISLLYDKADDSDELTLKSDALDILLAHDVSRIDGIKTKKDSEWEVKLEKVKGDQAGKVKRETMEELERSLMEKFEIDSTDKKGLELIDQIVSAARKTTLSPDEVKKHPAFMELEEKLKTEYVLKEEHEKVVNDFNSYKSNQEIQKTMKVVNSKALEIFRAMNPVLSEDQNKRAAQEASFVQLLTSSSMYQVQEDSTILLVDKEGKRIEDKHGIAVAFKDHVESFANGMYDFKVQDPAGNSNNNNNNNNNNNPQGKPADENEFNKVRATLSGKEYLEYHNAYCELFDIRKF